ncbi:MAG: glycosyltransferase family 2 protein [Candidatus Levybacteria bacterium]|nr:glycosyltransferase family 2 protein [Candidatus Levybacteria bacterium]
MNTPLVNIVIVTFNGYPLTELCLLSVFESSYKNVKIFLVDNGSNREEYDKFYKKYYNNKKLEFIRIEKNKGFAGGANAPLKKIKNGYIVFLNNDTIVNKNWLEPVINYMERNPQVGICQPKIKDIKRKDYFEYAGAAGGFMDIYGFPFTRGRIFFTLEKDTGQYDDIVNIVWSGVVIITKKEVFDKIGYFDELFFLYAEEADFCWRTHHAGYQLAFIPQSVIYHYGSKKNIVDKTFFNHRNGLIMLIKNYSTFELIRYLPIRLLFDGIAFLYYLCGHTPIHCIDMIKAYCSLFNLMPQVISHRRQVNKLKKKCGKVKFKYPLYPGSIVVDYFLKGKKTFKELNYPNPSS